MRTDVGNMIRGGWRPDHIFYHGSCLDGHGAAVAVHLFYTALGKPIPEENYHGVSHDLPKINTMGEKLCEKLLFLDYTPKLEKFQELLNSPNRYQIAIIDHHKSALEILKAIIPPAPVDDGLDGGLVACRFSDTESAASLTWKELFPGYPMPDLYARIKDRDLWEWQFEDTDVITLALDQEEYKFASWIPYLDAEGMEKLKTTGGHLKRMKDNQIKQILHNQAHSMYVKVGEQVWKAPAANASVYWSEIGHKLLEKNPEAPFVVVWSYGANGTRVSFRSRKGGFDVSKLASSWAGGGGHGSSSGCNVKYGITVLPDGSASIVAPNPPIDPKES